ncbi:MAG: radical SAM protein [Prolixibacteraceae bacterium]|nr:radical SAM protein [Prolixibacteraceae bacterium]
MFKMCNSCDGAYSSLDVRFTKSCDNACPFCIERMTGISDTGMASVSEMIQATYDTGIKNVLILGGEPMLYPERLLGYILGIRHFVDTIYITTSIPFAMKEHSEVIKCILNNIDGLNVSIQSTDWRTNNKLMNASSDHNRLEILRELNKDYADKIRVNLNLTKDGIGTIGKLTVALEYLESIGCKHVKLNELQGADSQYVSYEDMVKGIFLKLKSPYAHGCQTRLKLPFFDMEIILKRSCFVVSKQKKAGAMDLLKALYKKFFHRRKNKFAVLYENAKIERRWLCSQN